MSENIIPFGGKKEFNQEKIVPLHLEDFCEQEGINQWDYYARGVHVEGISPNCVTQEFLKKIPEGTEFVVEYSVRFYSADLYDFANAYGVALIPKKYETQ